MFIEFVEGWETKRNWILIVEEIFVVKIMFGKFFCLLY